VPIGFNWVHFHESGSPTTLPWLPVQYIATAQQYCMGGMMHCKREKKKEKRDKYLSTVRSGEKEEAEEAEEEERGFSFSFFSPTPPPYLH